MQVASHSELFAHGAGTLLDLINGYDKCKAQRQALESYMRRWGLVEARGIDCSTSVALHPQSLGGSHVPHL